MLLHLLRRRELVGDSRIKEEDVLYTIGWVEKAVVISSTEINPNKQYSQVHQVTKRHHFVASYVISSASNYSAKSCACLFTCKLLSDGCRTGPKALSYMLFFIFISSYNYIWFRIPTFKFSSPMCVLRLCRLQLQPRININNSVLQAAAMINLLPINW